ncbi:hypothetical protein BH20ACT19_BH20ACT19_06970 [soil metagenome]
MPTEPAPLTLSDAVHRAVEAVDPTGLGESSGDVLERFEDRDQPIASLQDPEATLDEAFGAIDPQAEDGRVQLTRAVATYLAFRRDEATDDDEHLLRLAARAEYGGDPPEPVLRFLEDRGIAL